MPNQYFTDKMSTSSPDHYRLARLKDIDAKYIQVLGENVSCSSSRRPIIVRLLWILSVSVMIGFCVFLVYRLIGDYAANSSYNTLQKSQATYLTLPAMTICNLNALNKTMMQAKLTSSKHKDNETVYDIWKEMTKMYVDTDTEVNTTIEIWAKELDDTEQIYSNFAFDIKQMSVLSAVRFSKKKIKFVDHGSDQNTELGKCWEINDHSSLQQFTAGPIGGLEMILDARSPDYVEETEGVGFSIIFRQPNETVLNKEFAIYAAVGQKTMIDLRYGNITRLSAPHGSCNNIPSYFNPLENLSSKECFLSSLLWSFMNTTSCQCLPWYFAERYATNNGKNSAQMAEFGTTVMDRLVAYWTSDVTPEQYKLNIATNITCRSTVYEGKEEKEGKEEYEDWLYTGKYLTTKSNIAHFDNCSALCYQTSDCVCFMYLQTNTTNLGNSEDCILLDSTAKDTRKNVTGLISGRINCTEEIETCGISTYASCVNEIVKERESGSTPEACSEPCQYTKYTSSVSTSAFPSEAWWNDNKVAIPHYSTWDEAK